MDKILTIIKKKFNKYLNFFKNLNKYKKFLKNNTNNIEKIK